ncbi:hypothetical protein AGABI2DRAFT_192746 [Agaricus bisporus var. bisporus H97]|uniref:hypothetical protein n=1 Tax=Agaricus bisporus var. bisporus (strain H97 / ATCC MYA-4626 / FGSC 10389) TaxID=936046 RepID=UPI00029F5018|nr:hypothetical protein AGABI2DRAFT_192746 [Agaricus bisporus var. bisporus H97]EKV47564.1 hypothetical protein AGABI2DRAFT_192746 [Agaricus bisporus var. bisporus H97]
MIAGAHFRRIGQPRAAIDIMYAMLEVMVKNGFVEAKLKPVFLLLSGCELDMAISARNAGDLTASEQHYANVQMWLQKVYGTTAPAPGSIPSVGPSSPVQSKQTQPSQPRETDYGSPRGTVIERISGSKRKLEEGMPMERNVRRRNTGPTRAMKRFKEKRRYSSNNKENRRFNRT